MKDFLSSNELCATNTFFIKKSYATKYCNLRNVFYTTDFIFVKQKDMKFIRDSGVNKRISTVITDVSSLFLIVIT